MSLAALCRVVSFRPVWIVAGWLLVAVAVGLAAPSLTRLAAEGQANLLPEDSESRRVSRMVARAWPDQASESMAVAALYRPGGLTEADRRYALELARLFEQTGHGRPRDVLRVLGPQSAPEVAGRLTSRDRTLSLVAVPLSSSFVSPSAHRAVAWLQGRAETLERARPAGLGVLWTGDAVIGRDYMGDVQASLDRAALATVGLLLAVLLFVYRSVLLALVPLATIGVSLVVARGVLAWLVEAGWEVSPLVELFLVVVLFGSGTDFCLFLAWRFGEHWSEEDPARAMVQTLESASHALLTSAGTVIAGLSLMRLTRFKLFSSTGPSVALGLALTLLAALTFTPALLVLLARSRPRAFAGLRGASCCFWERIGRVALRRPLLTWLATLGLMAPAAALGLRTFYTQDILSEMPRATPSVQALRVVASKFGSGFLAPLTVVLRSPKDLRSSEGLALIDDASRFLTQNRRLSEVRSATQPLGSTAQLDPARISSRLAAVNAGFARMADGASQLRDGLGQGVRKLRAAIMIQSLVGGGKWAGVPSAPKREEGARVDPLPVRPVLNPLVASLEWTANALTGTNRHLTSSGPEETRGAGGVAASDNDPSEAMARDLGRAAEGAGQIADGARRAHSEVSEILDDPVGRQALDRLLITPRTIRDHPELVRSFAAYIAPDGKAARIDVIQDVPMSSEAAMDQVVSLRRRLSEYLVESRSIPAQAGIAGSNAEGADIRSLTRSDQHRTWVIVPLGVFLILMVALRDPWACLNLVATMLLTYAFALGITHLVFVTMLGAPGIDWKVPYFLFVLLVAVGVDYNVFLMSRLREETKLRGLRSGIQRAVGATGALISSAAAITACSFASLLLSPLSSLRELGFALVVGILVDAVLVRPILVPCGHWLMKQSLERNASELLTVVPSPEPAEPLPQDSGAYQG